MRFVLLREYVPFGLKLMFAIACGGDDSADAPAAKAPAAEKEVSEGMKKESVHEDAKKNWHTSVT
jgi:hypothetical protein